MLSVVVQLPIYTIVRFSWQVYWGSLPFPPPVNHIWSELSTVTCPSWVALRGKAHSLQAVIYDAKAFDRVDHNKLWKALKEMGIPDHLTCPLRNLYVGQEATVRTLYGTIDWFKIEKEVQQGCLLSLCLTYMLSTS